MLLSPRVPGPLGGGRQPALTAGPPVLSRSRINEKSVWCCGWLPCTPLRIAATAGHGNCVDFLIRKGAEVDLVDVKGQTALYVAVVNGHLESAQILLEAGADPNGSRHHRSTPVYHASRVGRADILKALIRSVAPGAQVPAPPAGTRPCLRAPAPRPPPVSSCSSSLSPTPDALEDLTVSLCKELLHQSLVFRFVINFCAYLYFSPFPLFYYFLNCLT